MNGQQDSSYEQRSQRRGGRRWEGRWANGPARTKRLCRDSQRRIIGGVCAGIAKYYGAEPWLVRCIALTGLIFLPSLTFVAYWVLFFFVMNPSRDRRRRRKGRSAQPEAGTAHAPEAPELGVGVSPRRSLRNLQADLMQAELRLRRMEAHITSERYELQKEFNKINKVPGRG